MNSLKPENGLIFRITHIANVPWILDRGLHCRNTAERDPNYVEIGNPELLENACARPFGHHVPRRRTKDCIAG